MKDKIQGEKCTQMKCTIGSVVCIQKCTHCISYNVAKGIVSCDSIYDSPPLKGGTIDTIVPKEKWTFDGATAGCFENMLERSIPQYDVMRDLVFAMTTKLVPEASRIIDIGASRGDSIAKLYTHYKDGKYNTIFEAIECSEPMAQIIEDRFLHVPNFHVCREKVQDSVVLSDVQHDTCSIIHSVLTLMFTPIEDRMAILESIYKSLHPEGVFVLVEKVLGTNGTLNDALVDSYYDIKRSNGYSDEDILRKKASLSGVQVPLTAPWNEDMLHRAGFTKVECFWRCLNFAGWIAIK